MQESWAVRIEEKKENALMDALMALDSEGLSVVAHPENEIKKSSASALAEVEVTGQDRIGIVQQITSTLASQDINVEDFESSVTNAPWTGEKLFTAKLIILLPETKTFDDVRAAITETADDLMVEVKASAPEKDGAPTSKVSPRQ
ncbi:MAG: ACT domain-containing protein [Verrucomicrobiota bacterium]